MKFFKHIVTAFYKSMYSMTWLAEHRVSFGRALGYFFIFFFGIVLIGGYGVAREFPSKALTYWDEVSGSAPEFTVSVQQETLSINGLEQPYRHVFDSGDGETFLVYVDTVTTSSVSIEDARGDVSDKISTVILTSKLVKIYDQNLKNVQTENFKNVPSFSLTKEQLSEKIATFFQKTMPWLLVLMALFVTFFLGMWKLLYIGFVAWLVYVVARADHKPVTYWQVFTIGVYALTVPTLVQLLMFMTAVPAPYVYSIVLLGYMFGAIFYGIKKSQQPPMLDLPPPESPQKKK